MIFWDGCKIFRFIRDGALIEASCFEYNRTFRKKEFFLSCLKGNGFVRFWAFVFQSSICVYSSLKREAKKGKIILVEKIPIVSEFTPLDSFPERFAIRTKNIDLLRELLFQGKKVSWLYPDLYTQAHYLGILDFEHVFLDPYINTHIIYPNGEVCPADEAVGQTAYGWTIKYAKRVGFSLKDIQDRIDWKDLNRSRWKRGLPSNRLFIPKPGAVNLYNIFSLTYLIWQRGRLNATIAKKRTAPRK